MKILFVVPYVPSLIRVRPFNLVRSLTARGHQVTVMTLWTNPEEREAAGRLADMVEKVECAKISRWRSIFNCLRALPQSVPLQAVYSWQPQFADRMAEILLRGASGEPYDVVHVEHLRGVNYGLHLKHANGIAISPTPVPIIWDSVDCISHLFEQSSNASASPFSRWLTRFELGRTRPYEAWLAGQFEQTLVTSRIDRDAFISLPPGNLNPPITVLPNGVDLEYFVPLEDTQREPDTLVISGKMSYHANVSMAMHFSQEIFPLVLNDRPSARLVIVGKSPPREIQKLGDHPSISVTGTVPEILPYLQRSAVAVAPLTYGAGIQNKILEAMACGTPVAAYPKATAALAARDGQELVTARDPAEFAAKLLQLLADQDLRSAIGRAGRIYVEKHHNWRTITGSLEGIYRSAITKNAAAPATN